MLLLLLSLLFADTNYYYDKDGPVPLVKQKEVFIPLNDKSAKFIETNKDKISKNTILDKAFLVSFKDEVPLTVEYSDVYLVNSVKVIPSKTHFILKMKISATPELLKVRLEKKYNIKVNNITNIESVYYRLELSELPIDSLAFGNILSEDALYVDWAHVVFLPIMEKIKAVAFIDSPAAMNLGHLRNLNIVITIYDPKIILKEDLLPKIGNNFSLEGDGNNQNADELFYDFGTPQITKSKFLDKEVIKIVYPFRYLSLKRDVSFTPIYINYQENDNPKILSILNTSYHAENLTQDYITEITIPDKAQEIKPMQYTPPPINPILLQIHGYDFDLIISILSSIGFILFGIVILFLTLPFLFREETVDHRLFVIKRTQEKLDKLSIANWAETYKSIYSDIQILIKDFCKIPLEEDIAVKLYPDLKDVFDEINKIYQKDQEPNIILFKEKYSDFLKCI